MSADTTPAKSAGKVALEEEIAAIKADLEKLKPRKSEPKPDPDKVPLHVCNKLAIEAQRARDADRDSAKDLAIQAVQNALSNRPRGVRNVREQKPASPVAAEAMARAAKKSG